MVQLFEKYLVECIRALSKVGVHMTEEDYNPADQYDAVLTEEALRQQAEEKIKASAKPAPKPAAPAAAAQGAAPAANTGASAPASNAEKGDNKQ